MKLIRHAEYRVWWKDISHSNNWIAFDEVDGKIKENKPIVNLFYFVKETKTSYIFSSGIDKSSRQYWDLVDIPKDTVVKIEKI